MRKIRMLVGTLWILLGLLVTGIWSAQPSHAAEFAATACRPGALYGSYEFVAPATVNVGPGTVVAVPDHLIYASPAAYASKGILIFDGTGRFILDALENSNGPLDSPLRLYGDYTLESDCTAAVNFVGGTQLALKMVGNSKTQTLVSVTPGFVVLRPPQ